MTNSVTLRIRSTPFAHDPEGAAQFYEALGRAVFLWGRFDACFSMALLCIHNLPETAPFREKELPIAWTKRSKYWRKAFNSIPRLAPFKRSAITFIDDVMEAVEDRHVLTHSNWDEMKIVDGQLKARARSMKPRKGDAEILEFRSYDVTLDTLAAIASTADALNTRLVPLTFFLVSLYPSPIAPRKS